MIFEHDNYRSYLKALLVERIERNPGYSMRAMAKHLGVVSSQLSEVMSGKANFSLTSAFKVAGRINLTEPETEYFCSLVQFDSHSDLAAREKFLERANRLRQGLAKRSIQDLSIDQFKQISEWYHSAILELVDVDGFEFTAPNIARALGIDKLEAEVAVDRLSRLELLVQDERGRWKRALNDIQVSSPTRNGALRKFYRQMFDKASHALESQTPDERLSGYETMSFSPEALPEAREAMERFFTEMVQISKKHKKKTEVYHLLIHFFNLTKREEK